MSKFPLTKFILFFVWISKMTIAISEEFAYVENFTDNTVSVIATASNTVVDTISVGIDPFGIAITPNGKFVYVTNNNNTTVSVIETATNTVFGMPITVGNKPHGVAITAIPMLLP